MHLSFIRLSTNYKGQILSLNCLYINIYYCHAKFYKIVRLNLTTINDCVINNNVVTKIVLPSILLYTIGQPISLQIKLYADVDDLIIITLQYNLI